jgi:acyl-CoA dehydrogenase
MSALLERVVGIASEVAAPAADDVDAKARFPTEAIDALKRVHALSALIPTSFGGGGVGIAELGAMCEALGQHCAGAGMVFAMHQIQVATLVRHALGSEYMRAYMGELCEKQHVLASVTSEVGVGGDVRQSRCAVERDNFRFVLSKQATTASYAAHADALLITARRAPDAAPHDQVLVLAHRADTKLVPTGVWDTLGMRGTVSPPFDISTCGHVDQIVDDFGTISSHTMVPFSHVLWASLWLGIATGAVARARAFVRQQARAKPGTTPPTALRLAEVHSMLHTMRATVHEAATTTEVLLEGPAGNETLSSIGFALKMNNLKVSASQQVVEIVHQALLICGIMGYRNDTKFSLGRYLRDAHSAALMIGNDRVLATNASLLLVLKDD